MLADLSLPGYPEVFLVGDAARVEHRGGALPAVAPVAIQEGAHVARMIVRRLQRRSGQPFVYRDHGQTATLGRAAAVAELGPLRVKGRLAWLLWLFVHILSLMGFHRRLQVLLRWAEAYLVGRPGARVWVGFPNQENETVQEPRSRTAG